MRSQCAVYVDAGYLLAAAATRVTGTSLRSAVDVDHEALISSLVAQARDDSGLPVLRVNWYDSGSRPGGLPDFVQEQIGLMPKVKLRLGRRSLSGEQKGVDLRIGLDLATQGRARVVDVMYLVSGDDDLTEAVEEAQSHGVQVTLLAVPGQGGRPHAVARHLHRAADGLLIIDAEAIDSAVHSRAIAEGLLPKAAADESAGPAQPALGELVNGAAVVSAVPDGPSLTGESCAAVAAVTQEDLEVGVAALADGPTQPGMPAITPSIMAGKRSTTLVPPKESTGDIVGTAESGPIPLPDIDAVARQVIASWCRTASPEALARLKASRPSIPGDLDRALLVDLSHRSEVDDIPEQARHDLRDRFWMLLDKVRLA